ncbi:MAG: type II secretion system F family protein [Alphaproteobacteria bacterium]|nr:type II secretion system F family protein [Alphaproteobacteria bacterium]
MPSFAYEAAGPDGAIGRGVVEAPNRSAAVERILALGRTPVRIVEQGEAAPASFAGGARLLPVWGLAGQRLTLLQEFGTLLRAGLGVERALLAMQALSSSSRTKSALQNLLEGLRAGEPLSVAMRRADQLFPDATRRMIVAGEASGRLPEVMKRIADAEARNKELKDRAISAMIYPALLVVVMFAVLVMIFTVVVPRLEPLFAQSGEALPWPAAILLAISGFFNAYGTLFAIVLVLSLVGLVYALRQPGARVAIDRWSLRSRLLLDIPRRFYGAQFGRNLSMLLEGGMPLNRALETAQSAISNTHIRQRLAGAVELVRQGRTLKAALEVTDVLPRAIVEFAAVGEETGKLPSMMGEAADILDRDVQTKLDRLSALLLPAVTIFLGLVVAAIMSGVVTGILAANDLAL